MNLRRVDFLRPMPSPTAVAIPVPFLVVGEPDDDIKRLHTERYVESLIERDGFVWAGDVGYPRECIARVERAADPANDLPLLGEEPARAGPTAPRRRRRTKETAVTP